MKLSCRQIRTIMYNVFRDKMPPNMRESFGPDTVSYDTVKACFLKFKDGNFNNFCDSPILNTFLIN